MTILDGSLKLFTYHGRENGLMVVGSRETMQELTSQLQSALVSEGVQSTNDWPPELVSATVKMGPYKESWDFKLSFHIEGAVAAETKVPMSRRTVPTAAAFCILALAAVGFFTVAQWAANGL
jgi:hypothetical protein